MTLVNVTVTGATEDVNDRVEALVLRGIVCVYAAKLPITGSYFMDPKHVNEPSVNTLSTEMTHLLGALRDPKAFATERAIAFPLSIPSVELYPDVDALGSVAWNQTTLGHHLSKLSLSVIPLQEMVVDGYYECANSCMAFANGLNRVEGRTVSLAHLSTTDLAASTIGTAVTTMHFGVWHHPGLYQVSRERATVLAKVLSLLSSLLCKVSREDSKPSRREDSLCSGDGCYRSRPVCKCEPLIDFSTFPSANYQLVGHSFCPFAATWPTARARSPRAFHWSDGGGLCRCSRCFKERVPAVIKGFRRRWLRNFRLPFFILDRHHRRCQHV